MSPRGLTHEGRGCGSEMKLLVACCQSQQDTTEDDSVLQIMKSGIDWNLLLNLMDFHRVTPLMARKLAAIGPAGVPESVLEQVRYGQKRTAIDNLEQTAELLRVLRLLQDEGVKVIPFKGTVLARQLYGDLGLRDSCDIDLIVHQQDILAIKRILAAVGYVPPTCLSPAQEIALISSACVYEVRNQNRDVDLEICLRHCRPDKDKQKSQLDEVAEECRSGWCKTDGTDRTPTGSRPVGSPRTR